MEGRRTRGAPRCLQHLCGFNALWLIVFGSRLKASYVGVKAESQLRFEDVLVQVLVLKVVVLKG
jgi:hypothetical protein